LRRKNKLVKKILITIVVLILIVVIGFICKDVTISEVYSENNNFVYIDSEYVGTLVVYRYYDKTTKVIYMFTRNNYSEKGGGLTVMLDQNGNPLLYKEGE
jgi:uncharacterized protein YxeA